MQGSKNEVNNFLTTYMEKKKFQKIKINEKELSLNFPYQLWMNYLHGVPVLSPSIWSKGQLPGSNMVKSNSNTPQVNLKQ